MHGKRRVATCAHETILSRRFTFGFPFRLLPLTSPSPPSLPNKTNKPTNQQNRQGGKVEKANTPRETSMSQPDVYEAVALRVPAGPLGILITEKDHRVVVDGGWRAF